MDSDVKLLTGILGQFDPETVTLATTEVEPSTRLDGGFVTFGDTPVVVKNRCDGKAEATKKGVWSLQEEEADKSAQEKAQAAAAAGCGECSGSKKCAYVQTEFILVDTEERKEEKATLYRSKVTSRGKCGCESAASTR